ncbi:sulfatase-like hydrolase/transferase [Microbacterium aquimaris]|uniref:Sulfatase-like hydrolase/transferase n=1 Tax=Microbacterium aquimaris TaxID=459816 RepID=A0ABU5N2P5_9MICO|nr:sulfatase-like hydrolase/transferase [Microbacterium aquimaris]MDZ8160355.1 sulfatase-like hydrolase/transferase [Microbacterium aquimaris]
MARTPNIIQIVVDDMGVGDLSRENGGASSTPRLDAFAEEGVQLSQHYSGSPVCAPARAALLTGRYPHRTGVIDTTEARGLDRLAVGETTLADDLRAGGYATGLVGKWHNGAFDPAYHPTARGFDEFVGFQGGWRDYWEWTLDRGGTTMRADGRHLTDVFTDEALQFVRRHREEPFYLHLAYNAPHYPLQAPERLIERFVAPGRTRAVATIYAMIAMVDEGVERLLGELDRLGLTEDTIVMFTSDNGPEANGTGEASTHRFNLGMRGSKTHVFEGGIRVPLMVRWPAGLPGGERADLVHFIDWRPTLAAVAGVPHVGALPVDGRDVSGVLRGESTDTEARFWQWTRYRPESESNCAMREADWKIVWPAWPGSLDVTAEDARRDVEIKTRPPAALDTTPPPNVPRPDEVTPMLFDLSTDPNETTDLASSHAGRVQAMTDAMHTWFDDVERSRHAAATV